MCRHMAYVGPPVRVGDLLVDPENGLFRQSWAPRSQRNGTVNADGFGVGWYADGETEPARYRRRGPIWSDLTFADLARVIRTEALLAAVRNATLPGADGEAATAPFTSGPWLFSHNGALTGWPDSMAALASGLPADALLRLEARCDSALIWALVAHRLRAGREIRAALARTVTELHHAAPGSGLNLLLTDGRSIAGTAWGDSLFYRRHPGGGVSVGSEPYDADPGWREVPDGSLLWATSTDVTVTPVKEDAG